MHQGLRPFKQFSALQGFGVRGAEDGPRVSLDFRIYNRGPPCTLCTSLLGLKYWQTGQSREKSKMAWSVPSVLTAVMKRSRRASAACRSTPPPCNLSKCVRDHTASLCSRLGHKCMWQLFWAKRHSGVSALLRHRKGWRKTCWRQFTASAEVCNRAEGAHRQTLLLVTDVYEATSTMSNIQLMHVCKE